MIVLIGVLFVFFLLIQPFLLTKQIFTLKKSIFSKANINYFFFQNSIAFSFIICYFVFFVMFNLHFQFSYVISVCNLFMYITNMLCVWV